MRNFTVDRLDHVHLAVRDRRAAADWFARVLGLVPAPEHAHWADDPRGPLFLATPGGAHCLALFKREPETAGDHTIAFRVGGGEFARFRDALASLGLADRHGARVGPGDVVDHGGAVSLYFCDPDGNRIELTTYKPVPEPVPEAVPERGPSPSPSPGPGPSPSAVEGGAAGGA